MKKGRYAIEVARWYPDGTVEVVESGFNFNSASVVDVFEDYGLDPVKDATSAIGHYGSEAQGVTINVYKLEEF